MKIDGKAILDKLANQVTDRKKVSLYLSESLYEDFKKKCGKGLASQVMEELMKQFLESLKR
jgi:hypothetical protein